MALSLANGIAQGDIFAREPVNTSGNVERLGQEALDFTRTHYGQFVFVRQFVHTQDGDDVAQFFVFLQGGLYAARPRRSASTQDHRIQLARSGIKRIDCRVNTQRGTSRLNTTVASKWANAVAGDGRSSRPQVHIRLG